MLQATKHTVVGEVTSGKDLIAEVHRLKPDLILASMGLKDLSGVDALVEATRHDPRPSVLITPPTDLWQAQKALEDHVMAYLVEPITDEELQATIHLARWRFEQFEDLRQEIRDLKAALEARKTIERAKGILMRKRGFSEEEAYKLLRRTANDGRQTLLHVAEAILLSDKLVT